MKKTYVLIVVLISVVASGGFGFVLGTVGGGSGGGAAAVYGYTQAANDIANNSDARLVERPNGHVYLLVPNASESTGYQPVFIIDNSTSTTTENSTELSQSIAAAEKDDAHFHP